MGVLASRRPGGLWWTRPPKFSVHSHCKHVPAAQGASWTLQQEGEIGSRHTTRVLFFFAGAASRSVPAPNFCTCISAQGAQYRTQTKLAHTRRRSPHETAYSNSANFWLLKGPFSSEVAVLCVCQTRWCFVNNEVVATVKPLWRRVRGCTQDSLSRVCILCNRGRALPLKQRGPPRGPSY